MLPELPYPVVVPVVSVVALAAVKVLADEGAHPVAAARRTLHTAREHAAHAVVTVALVVACASAPAGRGVA
jgi:hypothetical protein